MEQQMQFGRLIQCLVERGIFAAQPFTLVDAGCSGGLDKAWRAFEPSLRAVGIDPVVAECARLTGAEKNPLVRYLAAFVGLPDAHPFRAARGDRAPLDRNPWPRLSAEAASAVIRARTRPADALAVLNDWNVAQQHAPTPPQTIDAIVGNAGFDRVDFVKIDIDGLDLDALRSAEHTIRHSPVLGLALEVNFYGSAASTDHTFHNTDRLLREWGFDLFDLSVRRYSSAALPQPFAWDFPAQTTRGRPYQGDAIYLRDPCAWKACPEIAVNLDAVQVLKLACLFSLFGLPDHAAELLADRAEQLRAVVDPKELLHLLAHEVDPSVTSYEEYMRRFNEDPSWLYPSRR